MYIVSGGLRYLICKIYVDDLIVYGVDVGRQKNAQSYFLQSLTYVVLAGLRYLICEIYVDDLIVYGVDEDKIIQNLPTIFKRLIKYKCVLKPSKCQFGLTKIEYVEKSVSLVKFSTSEIICMLPIPPCSSFYNS